MLLTFTFWALFLLPGLACVLRFARPLYAAGCLSGLAYGYAASFLLLSPLSLLCYALGAPLWVFSCGLVLSIGAASVWLARTRADRELLRQWRSEPLLPYLAIAGLLVLQMRVGGWLDGDASFYLGRVRVLLQHGFTNRDIYLAEEHFQPAYHSNLLLPVYASLAQLTRTSYLTTWYYSEAWAKLLVAAGHYVLGQTLTQRRYVGFLLAVSMITLNAGETYALYPNALAVGFALPMVIALGCSCLRREQPSIRTSLYMAGLVLVLAQFNALYALYALLLVGPVVGVALVRSGLPSRAARIRAYAALASLALALPFVLVSYAGLRADAVISTAPDEQPDDAMLQHAVAMRSGHLEKVLDLQGDVFVLRPERLGGLPFVIAGFAGFALALLISSGRRAELAGALLGASLLAALLFTPQGVGALRELLPSSFAVARMSTVLTSLLVLGMCAALGELIERAPYARKLAQSLVLIAALELASHSLGHAPITFAEHVRNAKTPADERHERLDRLLNRRKMLAALPRGATVLAMPRLGRQVVMLRDCYVVAADRGQNAGDERRRDLGVMNAGDTPWELRERLLRQYGVRWVTFELRSRRRYEWAYEHGEVRNSASGQDLIELFD